MAWNHTRTLAAAGRVLALRARWAPLHRPRARAHAPVARHVLPGTSCPARPARPSAAALSSSPASRDSGT